MNGTQLQCENKIPAIQMSIKIVAPPSLTVKNWGINNEVPWISVNFCSENGQEDQWRYWWSTKCEQYNNDWLTMQVFVSMKWVSFLTSTSAKKKTKYNGYIKYMYVLI